MWLVLTAGGEARALASSAAGDDTPRQPHGIREAKLLRTCHEWFLRWTEKHTRGR